MATLMVTKLIAPNIWGWIADHTGRHLAVIRFSTVCMLGMFCLVFLVKDFWPLMFVMIGFSFFWNAGLPQFEAVTLQHLGDDHARYGNVRLWGSVGFIVAVVALGPLLDIFPATIVPPVVLGLYVLMLLLSFAIPNPPTVIHAEVAVRIWTTLKRPEVWALLLVCCLVQLSHGPYYTFFTIYLEDHGYSRGLAGVLWSLGVAAEIFVFLTMPNLLARIGARRLMLIAVTSTILRWLLIGLYVDQTALLIVAQLLHMTSFGLYHAVAIHWIHRFFVGRQHGRGQALYSSLSFGLGGAAGAWAAGYLWVGVGPTWMFVLASLAAFLALVVAWVFLRESPLERQILGEIK